MDDTKLATVYRDRERLHAELTHIAKLAGRYSRASRQGSFRGLADLANEALASCELTVEVPVLKLRLDSFPAGSVIPCVAYWLGGDDYRCVTIGRGGDVMTACEQAYHASPVPVRSDEPDQHHRRVGTAVGEVVDVLVLVEYVGTPGTAPGDSYFPDGSEEWKPGANGELREVGPIERTWNR